MIVKFMSHVRFHDVMSLERRKENVGAGGRWAPIFDGVQDVVFRDKQINHDPIKHLGSQRPRLVRRELREVEQFLVDSVDAVEELGQEGDTCRQSFRSNPMASGLDRQGLVNV